MNGAEMIAAERRRQVDIEGFDEKSDDMRTAGELAWAAACYAAGENIVVGRSETPSSWPFSPDWDKRKKHSRVKQLAIAGALCAAEIDRLQRAAEPKIEAAPVICVFDGISVVDGTVIIQYRKMVFYGAAGAVEIRETPDPMRVVLPSSLPTDH